MLECQHISRQFSHQVETEHGTAYQYVCHDCQSGFISFIPPVREDYADGHLSPDEWEELDQEFDRLIDELDRRYF